MRSAIVTCLVVAALATSTRADVLVVDGGVSPGHHATIQAAIDAAAIGDTILVDPALVASSDSIVIDGKGLSVLVDEQFGAVGVKKLTIRNLPAGQQVTVRGLEVHQPADVGMEFLDNAGKLRLYDLRAVGKAGLPATDAQPAGRDGSTGALFTNCADVLLRNCGFGGGDGGGVSGPQSIGTTDGGIGGIVTDSKISAFNSLFGGGDGGQVTLPISTLVGGDGGTALVNHGSSLFFYGQCALGGGGGDTTFGDGGSGGTGYVQSQSGASLVRYATAPQGGQAGDSAAADDGDVGIAQVLTTGTTVELALLPTFARNFWTSGPAREGEPVSITAEGFQDDIWIVLGLDTTNLVVPGLQGALMVAPPFLGDLIYVGYVPLFAAVLPLGAAPVLPPGIDVVDLQIQTVLRVGPEFVLGSPEQITLLDASF